MSQFLSALPLDVSSQLEQGTLELRAASYSGSSLGELSTRQLLLKRSSDGRILVRSSASSYVASPLPVKPSETKCSFVMDCDEPAVQRVESALRHAHASPSAAQVVDFVGHFIEHKHMSRGFDIASVVAQKREGDCTEHAVLTAALLRASGFPSHLVTGLVVVRIQGRALAFGHAWAEYHDGKRWQLADATNQTEPRQAMAYLPLRVMQNEGPAYVRDSLAGFDVVNITAVTVPADPAQAAASGQ